MATNEKPRENGAEATKAPTDAKAAAETASAELQKRADEEAAQGFRGTEVDSTPNENYSVAGVTDGKPTPETDEKQADEVRRSQRDAERQANGVAER